MKRKTFDLIETKAEGDEGTFTALASVFGNVDSVGDRMLPGAFAGTLERWRESGDPIPVILSHQHTDPHAMIGKADPRAVFEDERGLVVQGKLDLENPMARQVHKLMKERLLKGWSFGYTVPKDGQKDNDGVNDIAEVDLIEVGPTLKGANPEAQLEAVKALSLEEETSRYSDLEYVLKSSGVDLAETEPSSLVVIERDLFPEDELEALKEGELKAAWTSAYIGSLPDSSFLYIAPGGKKDADGKTTPRSLRYFPVRDANGKVDLAHVRNALSRAPQSNLPQSIKDRVTAAAKKLLGSAGGASDEPTPKDEESPADESHSVEEVALTEMALELASYGIDTVTSTGAKTFPDDELSGVRDGELTEVWTTAYVDDLPDSHFLLVEDGGEQDGAGKTLPRRLRHWPFKNQTGKVDPPHLRNGVKLSADAEFLTDSQKDKLSDRARDVLGLKDQDQDAGDEDPSGGKSEATSDPLVTQYDDLLLDAATTGLELREPPKVKSDEPASDGPSVDEMERQVDDLMFELLSGKDSG